MKNDLTLEELKAKRQEAQANFNRCGCKIYREEVEALTTRINELEKALGGA